MCQTCHEASERAIALVHSCLERHPSLRMDVRLTSDEVLIDVAIHRVDRAAERAGQDERERQANEFLAARMEAQRRQEQPRCYGRSADALAYYGVGRGTKPRRHEYPVDNNDLAACVRTFEMAPAWARPRMLPVLEDYRASVAKRLQEAGGRDA